MKGYHYTSWENWQKIKEQGLIPYTVKNPAIANMLMPKDKGLKGIFTFKNWKKGEIAHYGQLIWAMMHHHSLDVILLSFEYEKEDVYLWGCSTYAEMTFTHEGIHSTSYGKPWVFHWKEPSELVLTPIPASRITLEAEYHFKSFIDQIDEM